VKLTLTKQQEQQQDLHSFSFLLGQAIKLALCAWVYCFSVYFL